MHSTGEQTASRTTQRTILFRPMSTPINIFPRVASAMSILPLARLQRRMQEHSASCETTIQVARPGRCSRRLAKKNTFFPKALIGP